MWSVRMRASKTVRGRKSGPGNQKKSTTMHLSGAEGLYESPDVGKAVTAYCLRALNHPRGCPDEVTITIEGIKKRPVVVSPLPVTTVKCSSPEEARAAVKKLLLQAGVSRGAIGKGLRVVTAKRVMRGASLIRSVSGVRAEPDKEQGIRVSRLGIEHSAARMLSSRLRKQGINTDTVREALILASKVASCSGIRAELCISDDPDYTTGYVASKAFGYVRIENIKQRGCLSGGRAFFIEESADLQSIITYLEKRPVIIGRINE